MKSLKGGIKIAQRIKKEVAAENDKFKKVQSATGNKVLVCGDLGCSESSCSTYCSES